MREKLFDYLPTPFENRLYPFVYYYGGKFQLAKNYPEPCYDIIIEPFAGFSGYSIHHHRKKVMLNDLNPKIIGVWNYLIGVSEKEFLRLPTDMEVLEDLPNLRISQEAKWLIGWRICFGGAHPQNKPTPTVQRNLKESRSHYKLAYWTEEIKIKLSKQLALIRHWKTSNKSYEELDQSQKATWFIDPPYQTQGGQHYVKSSKDIDYSHLGEWTMKCKGQIIACGIQGDDWLPFRNFSAQRSTIHSRRNQEMIYTKEHK